MTNWTDSTSAFPRPLIVSIYGKCWSCDSKGWDTSGNHRGQTNHRQLQPQFFQTTEFIRLEEVGVFALTDARSCQLTVKAWAEEYLEKVIPVLLPVCTGMAQDANQHPVSCSNQQNYLCITEIKCWGISRLLVCRYGRLGFLACLVQTKIFNFCLYFHS